ncbi:MAG TPA: hypothetical protein VE967_16840 [Gemmatimonadaceae bacterium]|nr:hypothetical protein [Gemmatimonadaceae bacterium]
MTAVTTAKVALAVLGIALFFWSNKTGHDTGRLIAIGIMAVAWLLRFVERSERRRAEPDAESDGADQGPSM